MNTRLPVLLVALATILFLVSGALFLRSRKQRTAPVPPCDSPGTASTNPAAENVPAPASASTKPGSPVRARMHNVLFHLSDSCVVHLIDLTGDLVPAPGFETPVFDDKTSFAVVISAAQVSITPASIADTMNNVVLAAPNAPLKDISITIEKDRLRVKGKLHSKGDIPFETLGAIEANPDGRLRIKTEKVKALKIPVKGMMSIFGIELANIVNTNKIIGMDTDKNDLLIDPTTFLPPPHLRGKVTSVAIRGSEIFLTLSGPAPDGNLPSVNGNYMAFRGGRLRFGKLTMNDSDLLVNDLDPADPLDWNQTAYRSQLVAGYSKISPQFGLVAYVRDYAKLKTAKPPVVAP